MCAKSWVGVMALIGVACGGNEEEAAQQAEALAEQIGGALEQAAAAPGTAPGGFRHENTPDNLRALIAHIREAQTSNAEAAAALTVSLIPTDEASLRGALRPETDAATVQRILTGYQGVVPPDTAQRAAMLAGRPSQTEVQVHGATTEEVAANAPGSVVHAEFPGGAVNAAETLLRPGVTWYEVELLEPGAERGMKFHLFYWGGTQWRMLGPVWRFL